MTRPDRTRRPDGLPPAADDPALLRDLVHRMSTEGLPRRRRGCMRGAGLWLLAGLVALWVA